MKIPGIALLLMTMMACTHLPAGNREDQASGSHELPQMDGSVYELPPGSDRTELSANEYISWVRDPEHGLHIRKEISRYRFDLQYKPYEYEALLSLRNQAPQKQELQEKISRLRDMQYYTFSISTKDGQGELLKSGLTDQNQYYARVEYFSFNMQQDIQLIDGLDTLHCEMYHYERAYDASPVARFILAFPLGRQEKKCQDKEYRSHCCSDKIFSWDDKVFGCGRINIALRKEDICSTPYLKID